MEWAVRRFDHFLDRYWFVIVTFALLGAGLAYTSATRSMKYDRDYNPERITPGDVPAEWWNLYQEVRECLGLGVDDGIHDFDEIEWVWVDRSIVQGVWVWGYQLENKIVLERNQEPWRLRKTVRHELAHWLGFGEKRAEECDRGN